MLTLQAQHTPPPPGISPSFFAAPSPSPIPSPSTPSSLSPPPMSDQTPVQPRSRRTSRHLLSPNLSSSSSSGSFAPFPKFHLGDGSSLTPPVSTGSRLRYGETWLQQDRIDESVTQVPDILLIPSLPAGRFVQTFELAPRAVASVIASLRGSHELLSFCHTSKEMRRLVTALFDDNNAVRDAFLSRIIRGYEPSTTWLNKSIRIDLPDTELLLESESVSLAAYPTHALRAITPHTSHSSNSSTQTDEIDNTTSRFQTLTLAHSRFIAYLRHRTAPNALQLASQDEDDELAPSPDSDGMPELIFPSPLFYFKDIEPPVVPAYLPLPTSTSTGTVRSQKGTKPLDTPKLNKSKSVGSFRPKTPDESQGGDQGSTRSRIKRLSLKPKKKNSIAPPPPSSMPPMPTSSSMNTMATDQFGALGPARGMAMSQSFGGHTRSRSQTSMTAPPQTQTFSHNFNPYKGYTPPPSGHFTPPPSGHFTPPPSGQFNSSSGHLTPPSTSYGRVTPPSTGYGGSNPPSISNRRRNRQSFHMPEWSSSSSGQMNRSMPFLNSPGALTPVSNPGTAMTGYDTLSPHGGMSDLHGLSQVFRLTRAPIFRVFVPCSQLNDGILRMCMAQLYAADLVPQLRAGDLVCNMGYVPDVGADDVSNGGADSGDCRGWMIFSGHDLRPLTTRVPIPVRDPTFVLNSPHYYSHVLLSGENPRFELALPLVPLERSPVPLFSLIRVTDNVKTPIKKAREGMDTSKKHKISKFVWLARVECARWGTEWLIEAEGTKEGRAYIEHAIENSRNGLEREWELIREKTGRGRVYIKKL